MSSYNIYRKNGIIKVNFPSGRLSSFENEDFSAVVEDSDNANNIIVYMSRGQLDDPRPYTDFKGENDASLGATRSEVISSLEAVLTSDSDLGASVILDVTPNKTETTQFVHDGDIDNGGAVVLNTNSALMGFQSGTFVKTTENVVQGRPYGRIQLAVDDGTGSGTAISAIDIVQGNVKQYPDITGNGDVVFDQDVILTSPNGTQYRLGVDNSGNLSTQAV